MSEWIETHISSVPVGSRWRQQNTPYRPAVVYATDMASDDGSLVVRIRYDSTGRARSYRLEDFLRRFLPCQRIPDSIERRAAMWEIVRALCEAEQPFGALILQSAPATGDDKPWASVQTITWDNPTKTRWIVEAETIEAAVWQSRSRLGMPPVPGHSTGHSQNATEEVK